MSKKKLGVLKPNQKQRLEIPKAYSLEQVCEILEGYLTDEVTIRSDPKRKYLSKNRNKPSAD